MCLYWATSFLSFNTARCPCACTGPRPSYPLIQLGVLALVLLHHAHSLIDSARGMSHLLRTYTTTSTTNPRQPELPALPALFTLPQGRCPAQRQPSLVKSGLGNGSCLQFPSIHLLRWQHGVSPQLCHHQGWHLDSSPSKPTVPLWHVEPSTSKLISSTMT